MTCGNTLISPERSGDLVLNALTPDYNVVVSQLHGPRVRAGGDKTHNASYLRGPLSHVLKHVIKCRMRGATQAQDHLSTVRCTSAGSLDTPRRIVPRITSTVTTRPGEKGHSNGALYTKRLILTMSRAELYQAYSTQKRSPMMLSAFDYVL